MALVPAFTVTVGPGRPAVTIDGHDVSLQVSAAEFYTDTDGNHRIALLLAPDGHIAGDGIVETIRDTVTGDHVRDLDSDIVRALVAERCTSMADDTYAATLHVVADLLDQRTPT